MAPSPSLTRRMGERMRPSSIDEGELVLSQRRIYILPTRPGLGFGALLLGLLIGSINYGLGLGYALTFLALSCALVDMVLTWRNLAYLRLQPLRGPNVFAGQEAVFQLQVRNTTRRARYAILVDVAGNDTPRHAVDVAAQGSASVRLAVPSNARGWLEAPRLMLSTRFPLGLFRAWSYWRPGTRALDGAGQAGEDDFAGVRPYQPGDPLRRLAWRQIARLDPRDGGQLATKHFEGGARTELVLDLAAINPQLDLELRLSRLTRWVLEAESRALPYAFRLGAASYEAANGVAHQSACLRALALYGLGGQR
jgi:uncharacterized protein (DUF58 family)